MAMTLRLPQPLEAEATIYAASLGLSFTNLVAVALREYLDARPAPSGSAMAEPAGIGAKSEPASEPVPTPTAQVGKLSPAERMLRKAQAKRAGGAA